MTDKTILTNPIDCFVNDEPDDIFITSVNFEDRCLGVPLILSKNMLFENCYVFVFNSEKSQTKENLNKLKNILNAQTKNFEVILSCENHPMNSISEFCRKINGNFHNPTITLDISAMPVKHLLILLKTLDDFELWKNIRIYYTEPIEYKTELYLPMSIGIGDIQARGEFIGNTSSSHPLLLVEFLGYDGDRARAVHNYCQPDETILLIPKPAFYPSWEGKTERMNNTLLKMVGKENIAYANPVDVENVVHVCEDLRRKYPLNKFRWTVIPLGTKPQALGVYLFWKNHPNSFTILHADPLKNNTSFSSVGIGKTRLLFKETMYAL